MNSRDELRRQFNCYFENWEIELPDEALSPGEVWLIAERGWTIWTRLDKNAEDDLEHLDFYATHRMTNDRHVRFHADGREEGLPSMAEFYIFPQGATEAEKEEVLTKYMEHNQAVEKSKSPLKCGKGVHHRP